MRTKIVLLFIFFGTLQMAIAQLKTEKFIVEGKCEMCKIRIENAAKSVNGVKNATWNVASKMLEISFNQKITSAFRVENAVARVGHKTKYVTPTKTAYNSLPNCCQYQSKQTQSTCGHNNI